MAQSTYKEKKKKVTIVKGKDNDEAKIDNKKGQKKTLKELKSDVKKNPEHAEPNLELGNYYFEKGNVEEGLPYLIKGLELSSEFADGKNLLGTIYFGRGENKKAEECFLKAIELDPDLADAYYNLGILNESMGDRWAAIENFRKATEINPKNPLSFNNLAIEYIHLDMWQEAEACLKNAIGADSQYMDAINNLVKLYAKRNVLEEAIRRFEECISRNVREVAIFNFLGACYLHVGEDHKAKEMWNESLALKPEQEEINKILDSMPLY